jgi:protein ImuB
MKLILCAYLPLLPLEALRPRWSEPGPFAVIEQGQVLCMSADAARSGVRPGMRAGGVAAVAPATVLLERAVDKEGEALHAIATALMQYTPEVALAHDFSVLMNVGRSLRLFHGAHPLCHRAADTIRTLGFSAYIGAAPTGEAAWLLARSMRRKGYPLRRRVLRQSSLQTALGALPCSLVPAALPFHDWLHDIGARDIGALRRLPRAGLQRRTSEALLAALDRAFGEAPELFEWLQTPLHFVARIETFDRVEHAEALLDGATRLSLQLVGWLVSLQRAVRTLTFYLEHERGRAAIPATELAITLAEPTWRDQHLIRLLRERLARMALSAPVIALRLEAVHIEELAPPNASLFPEPGGSPENLARLLELLIARLGENQVLVPAEVEDYRPEVCNRWLPASHQRANSPLSQVFEGRPCFVLQKPIKLVMRDERPFYGSPLRRVQGPERIEAGWWNDLTAARDYYVVASNNGACYWIYQERTLDRRWFLHGFYG